LSNDGNRLFTDAQLVAPEFRAPRFARLYY